MSPLKNKRVSKKSKLSWRKYVNINDVEEFLEDKRLEERLGPPLETLTNDELFKVETAPSDRLKSKRERIKLKLLQTPKCFALLEPHTKVPDPIKKRNRVRSKEERKNDILKRKEADNRAKGILKPKELQAIRDHLVNAERKASEPKRGNFEEDIWSEEINEENACFSKETIKHNLVGTGKSCKTVRMPKRPKSSVLPSVEVPHPGMSYNPSFDDHQDLLKQVAEKEMKIIKEEEHLTRVTTQMFTKVPEEKRDSMWLEEMIQGLPTAETEVSDHDSDGEYKPINPPTKNKKKTLKQRRKQKEQMQLEQLRKMQKIHKKKVSDLHQLKSLSSQLSKTEIKNKILREKRQKARLLKKKEPKRLSSIKFEETELDFNIGPDIAGNLRNLKKEGCLLKDRFKSFQKRNIIQPSIRQHRKKPKIKVYTKPGHKDDWATTVARSDLNKT